MTTTVDEVWTYAGERLNTANTLSQVWYSAEDKPLWFQKLKGDVVGGRYGVKVDRDEAGEFVAVARGVTYISRSEDERTAQWEAEQRIAQSHVARYRRERSDAKRSELEAALKPLIELRRKSCRTLADRGAFTATVIDYLYRSN